MKKDVLSGLTVALALVPEAVAFSFVAGVEPLVGLYAAFLVGLITAAIGGRPGMISGATGALAVVMVALVKAHGVEYLFAAVLLMGFIQILAGVARLGKFVRLIPHPVMLGFVNGLAIVIFLAQLSSFKVADLATNAEVWMSGSQLYIMAGLVALTMAIIYFLPKLTKAIPSSLAAIIVVSMIAIFAGLDTVTVGDKAKIAGGLPQFHIPMVPFNLETLKIILPYSVILAAIGLIESLMTLSLVDEVTETHGSSNKECVAQGLANVACGVFGAMGGCAMIGQSMINVNSGGRGRASGISAAIFLLIFILFASQWIEMIPIAALTGVMFMVVIGTFAWSSLRILHKIPKSDAFVLILVSGLTVVFDLAIAVASGVVVSALVFAWENAVRIRARRSLIEDGKTKLYEIYGPLFFGSITTFNGKFDIKEDPENIIVDFKESRVMDHSGLEAINKLAEKYQKEGKTIHFRHLSADCKRLLDKAGDLVQVNVMEDPEYQVSLDRNPI
ncbi:SulP family inorganic anion transporter [Aureibacter tunicatorum]|uniref:SulP family sulfate permease n=1 Tax=Aureibacter tunicatorum TaxID=866807 RepID=A0AAE4BUK6_9BACT|nr:SulP family inorganic anion transporter [Aureibacter tunicatorum]MDR6240868.1 SulP family sulfate permease [Aureibacter tunicatorum]